MYLLISYEMFIQNHQKYTFFITYQMIFIIFSIYLFNQGIQDMNADHVVSHIGRALSLATVLRAVPYNAQHRKVLLPIDLMLMVC